MSKRKKQTTSQNPIAFIAVGIGLIAVGVAAINLLAPRSSQTQGAAESSVVPVAVNYPAPSVTLKDLEGNSNTLSDHRDQVVLVNMWATWCPPCVAELPTLNAFYKDHSGDGFVIIGIDDGEAQDVVQSFVTQKGLTFPIWLDPSYLSESAFKTMNLPSSFLIDRQGQVRLQWVGGISRAMLDKYVVPIINE